MSPSEQFPKWEQFILVCKHPQSKICMELVSSPTYQGWAEALHKTSTSSPPCCSPSHSSGSQDKTAEEWVHRLGSPTPPQGITALQKQRTSNHRATSSSSSIPRLHTRYVGPGLPGDLRPCWGKGRQESLVTLVLLGYTLGQGSTSSPVTKRQRLPEGAHSPRFVLLFPGAEHIPICNQEPLQTPSSPRVTSQSIQTGNVRDIHCFLHASFSKR